MNRFVIQWVMPSTIKEELYLGFRRKKRRCRAWDVALLALMWVIWRGRHRRPFEGFEEDFVAS